MSNTSPNMKNGHNIELPIHEEEDIQQINPKKGMKKLNIIEQRHLKNILGISTDREESGEKQKPEITDEIEKLPLQSKFDSELEVQKHKFWLKRLKHAKILALFTNLSNCLF